MVRIEEWMPAQLFRKGKLHFHEAGEVIPAPEMLARQDPGRAPSLEV
jgi:hypothetical protein